MDRTQAKLLRALMKEPLNFWQLAGKQDDALRGYVDALTTLKNKGYIEAKGDLIAITKDGRQFARANGLEREESMVCPTCGATGVKPRGWLKEIMPEYEQLAKGRPEVTAEFDQGVVLSQRTWTASRISTSGGTSRTRTSSSWATTTS